MNIKEINDIVKGLSRDEREFHKELIAECKNREIEIHNRIARSEEITLKFKSNLNRFESGIEGMQNEFLELLKATSDVIGELYSLQLLAMPDESFYQA